MSFKDSVSPTLTRLADVLNWLQGLVLLAGFCGAGFLLGVYVELGEEQTLFGAAALLGGSMAVALVIASLLYIFLAKFRILSALFLKAQITALIVLPVITFVATQAIFEARENESNVSQSARNTTATSEDEEDKEYSVKTVYRGYQKYRVATNHENKRVAVAVDDVDTGLKVFATVFNNAIIATAVWKIDCEPGSTIEIALKCNDSGNEYNLNKIIMNPDWDSYDGLKWEADISGYKVKTNFKSWPLDESRRVDAAIASTYELPNPIKVGGAGKAWKYAQE